MNTQNGKSAAKSLSSINEYEKGSTTIPNGSTTLKSGKQPVYLNIKNVIYKITCTATKKIYIGSASFYDKRIGTHVSKLRRNIHNNPHLQNAWNKYGESSFKFEILEYCNSQKELLIKEQYWLIKTDSCNRDIGYNISCKAGSNLGKKMSEEAKKKIGNFWRGKKFSSERIKKLREDRTKAQGKAILVFDKQMNLLYEFNSVSETARQLNVSIATISKQCSRKSGFKKSKNSLFIFRYKDIV